MRYTPAQVVLHWVSAVVILWTLVSGFYVAVFDVVATTKEWVGFVNVSLTSLYIPVFILRVYYSFMHGFTTFNRRRSINEYMALFVHKAIYLVLGVVLVSGVLMMDRPINLFDVLAIAQPLTDPMAIEWFMRLHIQACIALLVLVAVHVGAVIKHEMCGRRVLKNMSFSQGADLP
ncbi:cytochrome b/b6 domain-containing protein [Pseudomonas kairouanensis]|uniref:Cytochrome b/b6 domain-containing protein n=1 Tax=Pseudomonas kairouanensis TaxID=2293832 RepID=A0A4Z0AVA8_9PSED|nr:cytochrome b/b6 domain-containing protein [Pseudomonas kairouanensis]TFY89848.1 cytochrome b/b6 domain-containing protein [Pseudomonas kairouanensis]